MSEHAGEADVIYTRWQNEDGDQFPFSPYSREAHIRGLDFVGTDVLLSGKAVNLLAVALFSGAEDIREALRKMAQESDITFKAVDAVTYVRMEE